MAEDQRPPGADIVDVWVAVGVPDPTALAALNEERRAANRAEGPTIWCTDCQVYPTRCKKTPARLRSVFITGFMLRAYILSQIGRARAREP